MPLRRRRVTPRQFARVAVVRSNRPARGGAAAKIENLAADLSQEVATLQSALVAAGLSVPEKVREKPVFVEHAGEIFGSTATPRANCG
jgi:hypothetical protein